MGFGTGFDMGVDQKCIIITIVAEELSIIQTCPGTTRFGSAFYMYLCNAQPYEGKYTFYSDSAYLVDGWLKPKSLVLI